MVRARRGAQRAGGAPFALALVLAASLLGGLAVAGAAAAQGADASGAAAPGDAAERDDASRAALPAVTAQELSQALERLAKLEFDLGRALESARLDLDSARRRFEAAQQRLDAEPDPSPELRDEVAARRLQLSTEQRITTLLEERLERVAQQKQTWRRLHQLEAQPVLPEVLADWDAETENRVAELGRELAVKRARLEEVRQDLQFTREKREQLPTTSPRLRWMAAQERALEELAQRYEEDTATLEEARRLEQALAASVARENEQLPLSARLRGLLHQVRDAWNYELTGSEQEPITPGKIVTAIAIFLVGWWVARVLSHVLGSRVFARMRLERGAAVAFESLAFYFLMLGAFLTALRIVEIPLTAFAVVGGALAIGVGFGSQNVVNNFISGIILLAERPIKLGDLIDVDGVYGNVEQIGLRSTRIRTGDNVHIIVPNAAFLEGNVINWTHNDPKVRISVSVGVAYGSPTREVERLVLTALQEHPGVRDTPAPVVLFKDFGNDALAFEMRFWIEMRGIMDRLRIESDVRYRVDELFREAGIVIAFPQRDVHLDSDSPLRVRLVDGPDGPGAEGGAG